jgi:peroxiredoxin
MTAMSPSLEDVFEQCRDMDGSLGERLGAFADAVRLHRPQFMDAVDRLVKRLAESGAGAAAPKPGDLMPPFVLPDETGELVSLGELLQKGPVAVTFHRGHWCPYCRININALAKAHEAISREGGQIIAIMPERQEYALELKTDGRVPFPILSDIDNGYAMSINLAVWIGDEMKQIMRENLQRDLATFQGNDSWMLPIPATFVVARNGRIAARFVDPDYRKRMAIDDLLVMLRSQI